MAVTDWHLLALIASLLPLRWFAALTHPEWYIGSEIAVYFPVAGGKKKFVVPDLFVALAPNHLRTSFDIEEEGGFPPFVLEIVSEESQARDTGTVAGKVALYGLLGAQEYAIFDPERRIQPQLQGYHRTPAGAWVPWPAGTRGELVSRVLGLTLVADEGLLRLKDADGKRLLTPDEERLRASDEHERAEREQAQAKQERARVMAERRRAAAEQRRAAAAEAELQEERARSARLQAILEQHGIPLDP